MRNNTQETKGFNFKTDSPSLPLGQSKKRRAKFNFNKSDISDDDDQAENVSKKLGNQSFFKTTDSLHNQSFQSQKQKINSVGLRQLQNQQKKGGLQTKIGLQKNKAIKQTLNLSSPIHADQIAYIQKLFFSILILDGQQQFKQLVHYKPFVGHDQFVKQQALLFLSLDSFLKQRHNYSINPTYKSFQMVQIGLYLDKITNLKRWALYQLRSHKQFAKLASDKRVSQQWMLLAQGKINQLANNFIQLDNYQQAILVSNIQDKSFIESFQFNSSTLMKKQYNLIQSKNIKITPNVAWPVDFAVALMYFDQNQLQQYVQQIFEKYHNSLQNFSPALEPALLTLALAFSQEKINQKMLERLITSQKRLNYFRQVLFFYALKDHQNKYLKIIKKLTQSLIVKIHNPQLFIELLMVQKLQEKQIKQFLNIYLQKNKAFLQQKQKRLQQLYENIKQRAVLSNFQDKQFLAIKFFYEWMICEEYLKISSQNKYFQSLKFYINNFQQIKSSKTHQKRQMIDSLIKNVVRFQLACTYKDQSRRSYYVQLEKLHNLLQTKYEKTIILGSMAYLELKFNIFWLQSANKLNNMYQLYLFLNKNYSQNLLFITNIRKTLENIFTTLQGTVYLTESVAKLNNQERVEFAEIIKKQIKIRKDISSTNFSKVQLFKILEMLNWNNKIANLIVIKLLFY